MPSLTFTSAILNGFSRNQKGAEASFTTSLTQAVYKAMEWDDGIPECLKTAKPEGELVASSVDLVPEQKDMAKMAVSLGVSNIASFEIVRRELEGQRGKGHRLELRFKVAFTDGNGCARLEQYMQAIGTSKGKLAVGYQRKAQQESLISDEQGADTARED